MAVTTRRRSQSPNPDRSTYTLAFPRDLDGTQVSAWLRSISGMLRSASLHFGGSLVIGFELTSDETGLTYRIKLPGKHAPYVLAALRSHVPGIRVTPQEDQPALTWTRSVEVGIRGSEQPLRIFSDADTATSLLASLQGLRKTESVLVQWVMTPAIPQRPPQYLLKRRDESGFERFLRGPSASRDEVQERRTKLEEPNLLAVLRVAAVATTEARADQLLAGVRAALVSTRSPAAHFVRRFVAAKTLRARIESAAGAAVYPIQLSVPEAAALIAWPIGSPHVAGLPRSRSRHLPPAGEIARTGLVVARANFPGAVRPLALSFGDACKHLHIVGPTGVGKTAVMGNVVAQAMRAGHGAIVMERKGDLFRAALGAVPRERLEDVIVMDMGDERPVGFNLLGQGANPRIAVEELCQLFEHLYPDMRRGIWARAALHRGLSTLITRPGASFIDLVPLLSPNARSDTEQAWRDELIAAVDDPELKRFWERFDDLSPAQQEHYVSPILDRVWQLNERPEIRDVIGQSQSSFTMREAIRSNKVLLVNLAGLGVETGRLAGTLLLNAIWSAVRSGACDPQRPTLLFLDEFQDFLNLPVDPGSTAAETATEARGDGVGVMSVNALTLQLGESRGGIPMSCGRTRRTQFVSQAGYERHRAAILQLILGEDWDKSLAELVRRYPAVRQLTLHELIALHGDEAPAWQAAVIRPDQQPAGPSDTPAIEHGAGRQTAEEWFREYLREHDGSEVED